jgi:hypothetical protein
LCYCRDARFGEKKILSLSSKNGPFMHFSTFFSLSVDYKKSLEEYASASFSPRGGSFPHCTLFKLKKFKTWALSTFTIPRQEKVIKK